MSEQKRENGIVLWTTEQWSTLTQQLEQMEEEIISARKEEQDKLAPSSFSYFLYNKKVEKYHRTWNEMQKTQTEGNDRQCRYAEWENLIKERFAEIIKQNNISQEDYPQNERIHERKERHGRCCIQWIISLHFNVQEIHTWNLEQWDAFIEVLFRETDEEVSLFQWLGLIGDTQMQRKMQEVKKCWEERPKRANVKPEVPILSFDDYLKWGSKEAHDELLNEIRQEIEQMCEVEKYVFLEVENAWLLSDVYCMVYQFLQEIQGDSIYRWEELAVKADLDAHIHQWEKWHQLIESDCDDRNMYESGLRHHHIWCCWYFERRSDLKLNGESMELRRYIALLACAPISETYREDCEKFLAFAKSDREGFSPEEIETYISDIHRYIYLPMLEQEGVPDAARDYYHDLLLELEKLINFRD